MSQSSVTWAQPPPLKVWLCWQKASTGIQRLSLATLLLPALLVPGLTPHCMGFWPRPSQLCTSRVGLWLLSEHPWDLGELWALRTSYINTHSELINQMATICFLNNIIISSCYQKNNQTVILGLTSKVPVACQSWAPQLATLWGPAPLHPGSFVTGVDASWTCTAVPAFWFC